MMTKTKTCQTLTAIMLWKEHESTRSKSVKHVMGKELWAW
jgi:hypothetical protein